MAVNLEIGIGFIDIVVLQICDATDSSFAEILQAGGQVKVLDAAGIAECIILN